MRWFLWLSLSLAFGTWSNLRAAGGPPPVLDQQILGSEFPHRFVSLLDTPWGLPQHDESYGLLALRRYYDGVIKADPIWTPTGADLRQFFSRILLASEEGKYIPTQQEARELQRADQVLYEPPSLLLRLKGITERRLRPEVERHLQARTQVLTVLGDAKAKLDPSLVFASVASLLATEKKIQDALRVQRQLAENGTHAILEKFLSRLDVGANQPWFWPAPDHWTDPVLWRKDIRLEAVGGTASCLVDVARIQIVRPWLSEEIWTSHQIRVRKDSDLWIEYENEKHGNETFFETMVPAIPVELLLIGNKRLIGPWTPAALDNLPKVLKSINSEPMIAGVIATRIPSGPFPDAAHFKFADE